MGKINLLDFSVANLIAAGEVVDRPASAVKELLENAIDAGSKHITVEIKNGGVSLIRIADDGCGMSREDVPIAVKRHATSKIKDAADLDGILTLGFRGEALAAIASVSKLRIMTKTDAESTGTLLISDCGEVADIADTGCRTGTTVIVEELFANVPARRKFLKRDVTEAMAVTAVVEKIALSKPEVAIKFINDGSVRFDTAGDGKLANTVYAVLGREFAKKMIAVSGETEGVSVSGFVGSPDSARGNRNYQNFFINGRYIKSNAITGALEEAFNSFIPSDRFPSAVLNLVIHPAFVDVNVHPAKLEVKFSDDRIVFNAVYCAVRNALTQRIKTPELELRNTVMTGGDVKIINAFTTISDRVTEEGEKREQQQSFFEPPAEDGKNAESTEPVISIPKETIKESNKAARRPAEAVAAESDESPPLPNEAPPADADEQYALDADEPTETEAEEQAVLNADEKFATNTNEQLKLNADEKSAPDVNEQLKPVDIEQPNPADTDPPDLPDRLKIAAALMTGQSDMRTIERTVTQSPEQTAAESDENKPFYRILGLAFNAYIFVELDDSVLIIDKHAAHERIIFEQMKRNMNKSGGYSQLVLIPVAVALSPNELAALQTYQDEITATGLEFSIVGDAAQINAVPVQLDREEASMMLEELAGRLCDGSVTVETGKKALFERALYQASCKAAMKAGRVDSDINVKWLCDELMRIPDIKFCPHGRPVAYELTKHELEKQFKRI